jgi:hypothetical protein
MCSPNTSLPPIQCPSRRNGKIAKLPVEQRDTLNRMLAEGATSTAIIDHFRTLKVDLNPTNITNWKEGGFQDWLRHQEALHELHNDGELAALLGTGTDDTAFHKGVLRLAMTKLFKALRTNQLDGDPANYNRLLTNLARLSRESLSLRKHLDGISGSGASTAHPPMLDPHRELTDDERTAILDKLDRILGFTLAKTPPATDLSSDSIQKPPELKPIQADLSQLPPAPKFTPKDEHGHYLEEAAADDQSAICNLPSAIAPTDQPLEPDPATPRPPSEEPPICDLPFPEIPLRPCESVIENSALPEVENRKSALENSDLPFPEIPVNPCESVVDNSSEAEIKTQNSKVENFIHPDLLTCPCCKAELPPLLPNGERPAPFCPKCRSALRHPATLKFYCPSCRGNIRSIWPTDETRTSDTCPLCYSALPPVDAFKKPEPPSLPPTPNPTETSPPMEPESAHAE